MKKLLIFTVLFISVVLCSCDFFLDYNYYNEVSVENRCGFRIEVNVTQSSSRPSAYVSLSDGWRQVFTKLDSGHYYLHITRPGGSYYSTVYPIRIRSDENYIVKWDPWDYEFELIRRNYY